MCIVKVRKKNPKVGQSARNNRMAAVPILKKSGAPSGKILFKDVLFLWMESNRICRKRSTNQKYDFLIEKHIVPVFGEMHVDQITAPMINRFLMKKLENGRLDHKGGPFHVICSNNFNHY